MMAVQAADKLTAPQLISLAHKKSHTLAEALSASLGEEKLKKGTAFAGEGPDFIWAVEGEARPGSVGLPYPATTIRIYSLETPRRALPIGETGEICISGPQVMAGYWKQPEETAKVMVEGCFATGDVGHIDKDGYVFITDRLKDMINASGFKIYPRNIEEAILLNPAVLECAVVGMPDPYRGQTVKAFVALKPGAALSAEALTAFLADKLTPIEMPKQIEFRQSLPKTTVGKISKKMLLEEGKPA